MGADCAWAPGLRTYYTYPTPTRAHAQPDDAGVNDVGYSARCVRASSFVTKSIHPAHSSINSPQQSQKQTHRPESPLKGKTPVLDALAAESVRLKEYYAHPVWCVFSYLSLFIRTHVLIDRAPSHSQNVKNNHLLTLPSIPHTHTHTHHDNQQQQHPHPRGAADGALRRQRRAALPPARARRGRAGPHRPHHGGAAAGRGLPHAPGGEVARGQRAAEHAPDEARVRLLLRPGGRGVRPLHQGGRRAGGPVAVRSSSWCLCLFLVVM